MIAPRAAALRRLRSRGGAPAHGRLGGGFTLVELLVALAVMALMAVLAWRGLDGMHRAQAQTLAYSDDVLALQAGLAQWATDLDAVMQLPPVGGIEFDGRVVRLTRDYPPSDAGEERTSAGTAGGGGSVRVVAWGSRDVEGRRVWLRWQSPALRGRAELLEAWQQAALWGQNPTEELRRNEVAVAGIDDWQVFYFRNDSWSSPLSSAAGATIGAAGGLTLLPDGVRLVLDLSAGQAVSGRLTRDWVRPTIGPGR